VAKRGRKPLRAADRNSEWLTVRVKPAVRKALERFARESGHSLSREVQQSFDRWIMWRLAEQKSVVDLSTTEGERALFADFNAKIAMAKTFREELTHLIDQLTEQGRLFDQQMKGQKS
jgi:hypothetical protein